MDGTGPEVIDPARRSSARGSEQRQAAVVVSARFTPAEAALLQQAAAEAGHGLSALVRHRVLGSAMPTGRRRPSAGVADLARLLGAIGQLGSDIRQLEAAISDDGGLPAADLARAVDAVVAMRDEVMLALGRRGS